MQAMTIRPFMRGGTIRLAAVVFACLVLLWLETAVGQKPKPLLLPGKMTLFQRVVTHPGARLFAFAGDSAPVLQRWVIPFTVFYVYQRASVGGTEWLEVGLSSTGGIDGWIKGTKVSEWRQALTLKFTERTGRQPVLFFKNMQSLEQVAASADPVKMAAELASNFAAIKSGRMTRPADFPILATEPAQEAISRQRFYLMPIFQAVELFEGVKFLELASIDPGSGKLPDDFDLRTGIVFVIDTTISMKPYIDRIRKAVGKIYDAIESAGLADKVAFGLVAFRNSTKKTPALEYLSKVLSDFRDGRERARFERALAGAEEAKVSTHSFNEDAFAGLKMAIEDLNWEPYQSRLALLISDAGAIRNDDPYSSTGMNEAEMADMAAEKGVKVFALHLKTPEGKNQRPNNHTYAEAQYRVLTRHSDSTIGDLYVPIEASQTATGVREFGRVIEGVAGQMVELVKATAAGERLQFPAQLSATQDDAAKGAVRKAAILGYAMQLDFLGRRGGVRAPEVVTSWVSDMDLARPDTPTFQVTVLLTKNQLSDLHRRLKVILDQAQRTKRTGARDFFQSILSAAAQTSRDPAQFRKSPNQNLGQIGFLSEFLDDLPYRSSIMRLTEEDWYRLSVGEQQAIVDDIKSKIRRYEQYHNDVANWVLLGDVDPGDGVYRVPLSMMP
jgi:serine/threonine-protein kinase PpkA